jgi:hypothetical protein
MELTEFIEKYRVSNFETYLKDDASIEYWQNLIIEFTKDFAPLKSNIQILSNPALKRPNENIFAISFGKFCQEQIEQIELKKSFKTTVEYSNEHLNIFAPFGFEIFNEMFEKYDISGEENETLNFLYSVMSYDNDLIKVKASTLKNWLNKKYNTQISRIRETVYSSKANKDRYSDYSYIKQKYVV